MTQVYCAKCSKNVAMQNPKQVLKNKRRATQGTCPRCGMKVFRMGRG